MLSRSTKTLHYSSPIEATPDKSFRKLHTVHTIHRTTSEPMPNTSFVEDTPPVSKKSTLRQLQSSTPLASEISLVEDTQVLQTPSSSIPPNSERRTVSDPTLGAGFLKMKHSAGIEFMLGRKRSNTGSLATPQKKKARKSAVVKLLPEDQRIFENQTIYWVPPNEKDSLRKRRIIKARERGATWTQELIPETTHIVVDGDLTFKDVMAFLKLESIPDNTVMVYDRYIVECIAEKFLLDPDQKQYEVREMVEKTAILPPLTGSQASNLSLQVKGPEDTRGVALSPIETPPDSQPVLSGSTSQQSTKRQNAAVGSTLADKRTELHPQNSNLESTFANPNFGAEFDEVVKQARAQEAIYISEDDSESERRGSRGAPDTGSDSDSPRPVSGIAKRKEKKFGKGVFNQDTFSCMKGGTGSITSSSPNLQTIEVLQAMSDHYGRTNDHWRHRAYQMAIGVLKKLDTKVYTYDEAINLPGIGDRLAKKIEEIALTGRLKRLVYAQQEPGDASLQLFMKIYGVGLSQAGKWVQQGFRSLEDLVAKAKLTGNQRIGIERYVDLNTRIPRDEVAALGEIVKTAALVIDPEVQVIIGGSYRRGATTSGDIDCLLTKPGTSGEAELMPCLQRLVHHLTELGFLVCSLVVPSDTGSKWHGCCVLPGLPKPIWRRIDFLIVPETQLGAALIYFTGDDIFNRSIRLLAGKKGYRLNQRGLYRDVTRGPGRVKKTDGTLVEGADEKKIFEALGVPYLSPENRICS